MGNAVSMPLHALNRLRRTRFARNVAVVATGSAGAQVITMAFAPLITRIYGPEAFGLLGTFMAVVAVAIPVSALAYPIAIVLPRDDHDALGLVRLSFILSFAIALLVTVALWAGGDRLTVILGAQSVAGFLFLIPAAMLFAAGREIVQQWLIRKKEFGIVARSAIAHSLILNSAKIGIGWLHPVGAVLIVLATLGHALHAALLFLGARRRFVSSVAEQKQGPRTTLRELAHRHRDFPLYRAPQNFVNAASQSLPVLMLAAFFGPAAAGFYALGRVVMGMPATMISQSVGQVFYPRIVEASHRGEGLTNLIMKATLTLSAVGIFPFAAVVAFGPWLFGLVFGSEWVQAGQYARWIALWLFVVFVNNPSIMALPVLQAQRFHLIYTVFTIMIRALVLVIGSYIFESDLVAVALFGVSGALLNLFLIGIVLFLSRRYDRRTLLGV